MLFNTSLILKEYFLKNLEMITFIDKAVRNIISLRNNKKMSGLLEIDFQNLEKSFFNIYDEYYDKILNYLYRSISSRETAEDLTGNTFLKAFDYLKRTKIKIENLSGWLYRIASNELISYYRYNSKRKDNVSYQNGFGQHDNPEGKKKGLNGHLEFVDVKDKLEMLKPIEKIIITMHFFENRDYKEMSDILNIKEETLRSKIHRTLKKLYKLLTE